MPHTDLEFLPATRFAAAELTRLTNDAFADYVVPMHMNEGFLWDFARKDGVDAAASLIAVATGQPVAFGYVARRGWSSRLAAFGVLAGQRRRGIGQALMKRLLNDARQRGDHRFELECIDQNPGAIAFYQSLGFRQTARLFAYSGHPVNVPSHELLHEVDPVHVSRTVGRYGEPDLPWQISAPTLAQVTLPARAYQLGPASGVVVAPEKGPVWLRAIVVEQPRRRQGWGRRLLSALAALHPGREWNVPALFPESIPPAFFASCGLRPASISQSRMELTLESPAASQP